MTELNLGGTTASPANVTGGRHRKSHKLRLVKKKTVRRMLAKHGLKMRGGGEEPAMGSKSTGTAAPMAGGRHRRSHRKSRGGKKHRGMFHF
jgi:hypothetical protein